MKNRLKKRAVLAVCIALVYVPLLINAQDGGNGFTTFIPSTHALIVGISNYKHIEDLKFADRDAAVFREYLIRTIENQKDTSNIVTLLNDAAVSPAIYKALEDLVSLVKEGDKVYIYFSGHGDSENTTIFRSGFLLTHDTPPNSYYTNSLNVDILNHFIHTLSTMNKAEVTFIADACRSGSLGTGVGNGVMQTAKALAANVADEIRVLSCQPNEVSLEGMEWGNGRGLFSYHLINGLYGLADDENASDGQVSLNELNIYLSTKVPRDAEPVNQYPGTYGPMDKIISKVQQDLIAVMQENQGIKIGASCKDAGCKAYEAYFLSNLDIVQLENYNAFNQSIDAKRLHKPYENNALHYLEELQVSEIDETLESLLRRKLVAALQKQSQLFIDQLSDLNTRWHYKDMKYGQWAKDLELSAQLIGPEHYLYQTTMGKHYFFNAAYLYYRSQTGNPRRHPEDLVRESLAMINKAIKEDRLVHYYHNLKGVLVNKLNYPEQAIAVFNEAIRLNPEYPYPYANKSWALIKTGQYEEAIKNCDISIQLDPGYTNAYQFKITALKRLGKQEEAIDVYRTLMRIAQNVRM